MSNEKAQRHQRREQLLQYYGAEEQPTKGASSNPPSRSSRESTKSPNVVEGVAKLQMSNDPYDMDSTSFDPDSYMQRLIKDNSLAALMNHEGNVVRQIHSLDSDMQTLVYENYNKFIAATDTIKKMRVDFRTTDDDMAELEDKMAALTKKSARVSESLRERRETTAQLAATHGLLKKMEFLFELPEKLKECIADKDYALGVKYYVRAQKVLDQYENMPSFSGIQTDCDEIMIQLRSGLRNQLKDANSGDAKMSPHEMTNCVYLLLLLNTPASELCDEYLESSKSKLEESLAVLERQVILAKRTGGSPATSPIEADKGGSEEAEVRFDDTMDILEFVSHGCDHFLSDACLVIASYNDTFISGNIDNGRFNTKPGSSSKEDEFEVRSKIDAAMATEKLLVFISDLIKTFFDHIKSRTCVENNLNETALFARALDRFHRRLQAMSRLLPQKTQSNRHEPKLDFTRDTLDLVLEASLNQCNLTFDCLKCDFQDSLMDARKCLVTPSMKRLSSIPAGGTHHNDESENGQEDLKHLNSKILTDLSDKMRTRLTNLQYFIDPELSFAVKTYYRAKFCRNFVREGIVVAHFKQIFKICEGFCEEKSDKNAPPPVLLLLLSRSCLDLHSSVVQNLVGFVDEHFLIDDTSGGLTTVSKLKEDFRDMASRLLNYYVHRQGQVVSTMLRKSVETRDWLNTVEPRTVRAVMKRVVEEVMHRDYISINTMY